MASEYQNKSRAELEKTISEKRKEMQQFRFDIAGSRIKNVKAGRNIRKEIARMMTALKQAIKS